MQVGQSGGLKSELNVTPMIDVVLVLLIIFMVVTPKNDQEMPVVVPQEATELQAVVGEGIAAVERPVLRLLAVDRHLDAAGRPVGKAGLLVTVPRSLRAVASPGNGIRCRQPR